MYAVSPAVSEHWRILFETVGARAGVPLEVIAHAAPASIEELWARPDLGCAFMCGLPFAMSPHPPRLLAAPIPAGSRYGGRAIYFTDLVVRADRSFATLEDTFGGAVGWTVEHSQSGYNALRRHLARYARDGAHYERGVGPLHTPRRVIEAVLGGEIDIGPLDSYFHDLLRLHEPEIANRLRIVASTQETPAPPLVAAADAPAAACEALTKALVSAASDIDLGPTLKALSLAGFASADPGDYAELARGVRESDAPAYLRPN